ncbi:MAG: gamma-glutamyl-gamma-aminobutyrate hydrolase family protein [Phycisphaerales bacterium]
MTTRPLVGITSDVVIVDGRRRCAMYPSYAHAVAQAGGLPVFLTHEQACIPSLVGRLDAFIFTGGDDPRTEAFGAPTDPRATPLHPDRQAFELALLRTLQTQSPDTPVLGICLGMQLMALVAGGRLDQHMPDTTPTANDHWEKTHPIVPDAGWEFGPGEVLSRHRQAVDDAGRLQVVARAPDGVIEAVFDPQRSFYLGVQWHPERTLATTLGMALFDRLVRTAGERLI